MRQPVVHLLQRVDEEVTGVRSVFVIDSSLISLSSAFDQ